MASLSPTRVAIYGWLVYLGIFLIAPVHVIYGLSFGPALYIIVSYGMFFVGCALYDVSPTPQPLPISLPTVRYRLIFNLTVVVALIGIGLRVYDRFAIRGASLAEDVLQRREALETAGSNIFSLGAAALFPWCFLVPFIYFLRPPGGQKYTFRLLLSLLIFSLPGLNAVLIGSRSILLTTILLFFGYLLYFGKLRVNGKTFVLILFGTLVSVVVFTTVFLSRLEAMGLAPDVTVYDSAYAFTVQPNDWITHALEDGSNNLTSQMSFAYLNLSQYEIHGLFEFSYLYNNFHGSHTFGKDTFSVFYKLAAFLFRLPGFDEEVLAAEPNSGVYTTFFGPLFVDFGWFGPIVMLSLGVIAQKLWMQVKCGHVELTPIYLYLAIVLFLAPVVNMISGAEGLLTICSFILYFVSYRWITRSNCFA